MSRINRFLLSFAAIVLMATMVMAVLNMILRPLGHPITGSFELLGFGSALVTGLGLGYSYEKKAHIAVDILFNRFSRPWKRALSVLGQFCCGLFFAAISWKMLTLGLSFRENGELSETLGIPFYPVTILVALGVMVLSLNLFLAAVKAVSRKGAGTGR